MTEHTPPTLEQPLMLFDGESEDACVTDFCAGRVAAISTRSPIKDTPNEDALAVIPISEDEGVLAVADGAGGMPGGERAARIALESLHASLIEGVEEGLPTRESILRAFDRANAEITDLGIGAATTLAVAAVSGRGLRIYHAGDSPVVVVGGRGKVKWLTVAHSPVGYAIESGYLDEEEAMVHEDRHLLGNCLGIPEMRIEVSAPIELDPKDTVLLASDGLYDNLHTEEIAAELSSGDLEESFARLFEESRRRMLDLRGDLPSKPDDLTMLAWRS